MGTHKITQILLALPEPCLSYVKMAWWRSIGRKIPWS